MLTEREIRDLMTQGAALRLGEELIAAMKEIDRLVAENALLLERVDNVEYL
jgi:hypothetical protein